MANPASSTVAPLRDDAQAVSAVVGTIMILAITVIGIAGVLYYGAPTIDRIQSRNAQTAMEGSFETLRDSTLELSVPDHARFPSINLPGGTLALAVGDRFLVAANHDASNTGCDLHVTDWSDTGVDKDKVTVGSSGCRTLTIACTYPLAAGTACLEIDIVSGSTITRQTVALAAAVASIAGADFSKGDWAFRITDANTNPIVYAEAWLHSADQVTWSLSSGTGTWKEFFDGGAVFSQSAGNYFLEKEATITDYSGGIGYYGLWLRTLVVPSAAYNSVQDQRSHAVQLSLLGVSTRVDNPSTFKLRFDISGPLAQPWCNALLLRNTRFGTTPWAAYAESAGYTCTSGDAKGLRSVTFSCLTCPGSGHPFKFLFLHARIATSLAS